MPVRYVLLILQFRINFFRVTRNTGTHENISKRQTVLIEYLLEFLHSRLLLTVFGLWRRNCLYRFSFGPVLWTGSIFRKHFIFRFTIWQETHSFAFRSRLRGRLCHARENLNLLLWKKKTNIISKTNTSIPSALINYYER